VFPVGIATVIAAGELLVGLLGWATFSSDSRPQDVGLLWFLPFALCEEIIFRGILQPLFVRRYGVIRGIFLVGIFFGAAHFDQDFSVGFTDGLVITKICLRLFGALALSFVAGWLTLRTESVFPAAVAHGLMNTLGSAPLGPSFAGIGPAIDLLWAALAFALFRYWPVRPEAAEKGGPGTTNPVPAS
jgi:membrane protease YdiL (CAAX protease family)